MNREQLEEEARQAQKMGESAGSLLGEYVADLLGDEDNDLDLIAAEMDNVIGWAKHFKKMAGK